MSDQLRLRFFWFYQEGGNGVRHYLLPDAAFAVLTRGEVVLLGGRDSLGRDISAPGGEPLVVRRIDVDPVTSFHEVTIDHPWWSRVICQKADYPMGTGKVPVRLQTHRTTQAHQLAYGY